MGTEILRCQTARDLESRAASFLMADEAEHNLLLGILGQLETGDHAYQEPIYLATVEEDGAVAGCAWRTPPHKVGLTRMPLEVLPDLAADVHGVYPTIPAVLGPSPVATGFASAWAGLTDAPWREVMRMGVYQADTIVAPPTVPGGPRPAEPEDLDLVAEWVRGFARDAHMPLDDPEFASRLVGAGRLLLWLDESEPRAMAAAMGPTPNGIRIGYVYTPAAFRGRGYGSAVTAAVSQRQLAGGRRFCFLYTDLANPTSNAIYQRLGYRLVTDVVDIAIG